MDNRRDDRRHRTFTIGAPTSLLTVISYVVHDAALTSCISIFSFFFYDRWTISSLRKFLKGHSERVSNIF